MNMSAVQKTAWTQKSGSKRNPSLQALCAIAFLGIFFAHVSVRWAWAGHSVSVFFVLSGFLLTTRHYDDILPGTLRERADFTWNHIKRIYPLHLITMVLYAVLRLIILAVSGLTVRIILETVGLMALNVTLLQSWYPHHLINVSLNGVAWFLSTSVFLYFMFPSVLKWAKRLRPGAKFIAMLLIPAVQILLCVPFKMAGADENLYNWFSYCFPVFRLGDFFAGCCLGSLCAEKAPNTKDGKITVRGTALELLALALTIAGMIIPRRLHAAAPYTACFNKTSLCIIPALLWVYTFSERKGLLSRLLSNPLLVGIGNISAYAFLIHYLVTQYVYHFSALLRFSPTGWGRAGMIAAQLAVSLLLSVLYDRFAKMQTNLRAVSSDEK